MKPGEILVENRRTSTAWWLMSEYTDDRGSLRYDLYDPYRGWRRGVLAANYRPVARIELPARAEVSDGAT